MRLKTTMMAILLLISCWATAQAQNTRELLCERPNSTRSFAIKLNAYQENGNQFAAIRVIQYPGENLIFYKMIFENESSVAEKIRLNNDHLYFEVEKNMILRTNKRNQTTLEVFWIRGCSYNCGKGNESGSIFYQCRY